MPFGMGYCLMNSVLSQYIKYVVIVGYCACIVITVTNTCRDIGACAFIACAFIVVLSGCVLQVVHHTIITQI